MVKPKIGLLILLILAFLPMAFYCQSESPKPEPPDCTVAKSKPRSSRSKIISVGVINGRALKLVKPEYPPSARAVNVRGTVQISVLIDESGCISEAKIISGHPLLAAASLKAAKASIFEPVTVSGHPIRVYGIINYNYLPNLMNWLEIGFSSDSYETLTEFLPHGFEVEAKLLQESKESEWNEKQLVLTTVKENLKTDLLRDPKNGWLFSMGMWLKAASSGSWGDASRQATISELHERLDAAPEDVSPRLRQMLDQLLRSADSEDFHKGLHDIELRLFDLGN